jgi:hypothetical protein
MVAGAKPGTFVTIGRSGVAIVDTLPVGWPWCHERNLLMLPDAA